MKQILVAFAAAVMILTSCQSNNSAAIESAKKATIDSMNAINAVKQQVIDSMNAIKKPAHRHNTGTAASGFKDASYVAGDAPATAAPAPAPVAKKKKGWSHTAKGAVVGAGAGAITGAIINKDRVKGAAIGTLIGAGIGAGTGAIVDHQKKKRAQQ
ncbi:glycine zipper domain-containing protein [Chitinophaga solisilvae]|uniref:Glycine zipper family protein n=1 Tax=Chitinophaga solisilvae TaxID=1233460 RepID=A0A3S1DN43_9BACT|nr:glycine zipper domain-containing protein [Chitinophaga solisilvae]NSL85796.1 glycine zipper family protein [Chitinophaga solisilvae]